MRSRRAQEVARRITALGLVLALAACGGALAEGKSAFRAGRYGEARVTLVAAEGDYPTMGPRVRAEYALYRGLTHGALGDRAQAVRWLGDVQAQVARDPTLLSEDDAARLKLGLEAYDPARNPAPE